MSKPQVEFVFGMFIAMPNVKRICGKPSQAGLEATQTASEVMR